MFAPVQLRSAMNPPFSLVVVLAVLFGVLTYIRTSIFRRQRGQNPWGMAPGVWLVVGFLLGIIGMILALIACATTRANTAPVGAPGMASQLRPPDWGWSTAPDPGAPPPGWYPDPAGTHQLRYFSGADWTEHVLNGGVPSTQALPPPPVPGGSES